MIKFWKTTQLDCAIAEELFGWMWLVFMGTPTRDHPQYKEKCLVRQFFSPGILTDKNWERYFASVGGHSPATGDEPLSYSYCSSNGPAMVPHYSGDFSECLEMEKEIRRRGLWEKYTEQLASQIDAIFDDDSIDHEALHFADCESRCVSALAVIGSKYVTQDSASCGKEVSP